MDSRGTFTVSAPQGDPRKTMLPSSQITSSAPRTGVAAANQKRVRRSGAQEGVCLVLNDPEPSSSHYRRSWLLAKVLANP